MDTKRTKEHERTRLQEPRTNDQGYWYTGVMRIAALALLLAVPLSAQTRKVPARKPAPAAAAALKKVVPEMTCTTPLGVGLRTKVAFCEVMAGRDPAGGVLIKIPTHKGPAMLSF